VRAGQGRWRTSGARTAPWHARRQDAIRRFLDATAAHYEFAVGGVALPRFAPPMRVARHETASGED
jgi:hypothetical protein